MFVDLEYKRILVVGGGRIAARRVISLLEFGCDIVVVAPKVLKELKDLQESGQIKILSRNYEAGRCEEYYIVIAATNVRDVNHQIAKECKEKKILVNVCDCKEECDFYFPGIVVEDEMVIGVTASGQNHKKAKETVEKIQKMKDKIF